MSRETSFIHSVVHMLNTLTALKALLMAAEQWMADMIIQVVVRVCLNKLECVSEPERVCEWVGVSLPLHQ